MSKSIKVARDMHSHLGARRAQGLSLIEMMVTMLIGAFLMIGVMAIFGQTRTAYRTNDTLERMQENVRFALGSVQPDLRLARNWGLNNYDVMVNLAGAPAIRCDDGSAAVNVIDNVGIQASNDDYDALVPCPAFGDWQEGSDVLVVRHASADPVTPPLVNGVVYVQSDRMKSDVFANGINPDTDLCPAPPGIRVRCTYDWNTNYYYISSSSSLGDDVPSLRRKTIVNRVLTDQELIAGVEDFQVQLGIDLGPAPDNAVDRYVDADDNAVTPGAPGFDAATNVLSVRIWLMFRGEQDERGFVDGATYAYADAGPFAPGDNFRRLLVNKTVMLRNGWALRTLGAP